MNVYYKKKIFCSYTKVIKKFPFGFNLNVMSFEVFKESTISSGVLQNVRIFFWILVVYLYYILSRIVYFNKQKY